MARWTTPCIVACWLLVADPAGWAAGLASGRRDGASAACVRCHESEAKILTGVMASRSGERAFADRAFGKEGKRFFTESCGGCHVTACADCHGNEPHSGARPDDGVCLRCHRGDSAGWEFEGKAVREDNVRYRRGATSQGEPFLHMLPDLHFERGMTCADCHPMSSLHLGKRGARTCRGCHRSVPARSPEHAIARHLETMACVACHAAWSSQEYGTFLIKTATAAQDEAFAALPTWGPWRKSAQLKRQDAPPLGLNAEGLVAPIRPRYVLFVTDPARGWENRLVAAEWRAFAPHTVRRGGVACGGCHDNRSRFILESDADRLYLLDKDGLPIRSYWNREGQRVVNGAFLPAGRFAAMNRRTPEFTRQEVREWQKVLEHAATRSRR